MAYIIMLQQLVYPINKSIYKFQFISDNHLTSSNNQGDLMIHEWLISVDDHFIF